MAVLDDQRRSRDHRRVAEILDPEVVARAAFLPAFEPRHEVRPTSRRGRRGRYRHAAEVDELLAPYAVDSLAGVPDRLIADRTGLSAQQVKQWRRRRRISGRRGRAPAELGTRFMISALLGEPTVPVAHEFSPVQGGWRPPAYALRRPLDYALFTRLVVHLCEDFSIDQIAAGIGIDARDIEMAVALDAARGAA